MLREPRFQEDRLQLAKENTLQEMKKRNDEASSIEAREWNVLMYGEKHYLNRFTTEASVKSITRDELVAFHKAWVHPGNMIAAVSGSFDREEMLRKLEAAFANWPSTRLAVPPGPGRALHAAPGLYRIDKEVNQGRVSIGLPVVKRDHPDIYALEVMNEILGGSGFTSRITKTVRSNEGLAYSAGLGLSFGSTRPVPFRAAFQSKSRTVAYAAQLVLGEIRKLRETPVTDEELSTIKDNLIATFPSNFASKAQTVGHLRSDEYTSAIPPSGRPTATASRPSRRPTCSASRESTSRPRRCSCWWWATRRRSRSATASTTRSWRRSSPARRRTCRCAIR
jgi:zinc protease